MYVSFGNHGKLTKNKYLHVRKELPGNSIISFRLWGPIPFVFTKNLLEVRRALFWLDSLINWRITICILYITKHRICDELMRTWSCHSPHFAYVLVSTKSGKSAIVLNKIKLLKSVYYDLIIRNSDDWRIKLAFLKHRLWKMIDCPNSEVNTISKSASQKFCSELIH